MGALEIIHINGASLPGRNYSMIFDSLVFSNIQGASQYKDVVLPVYEFPF